jgi:sulfoxide reductase heme-binding subunit YedZ
VITLATTSKTIWYVARGSGAVSTLMLSASVALGLLSTARVATQRIPRFVVQGLHRNVSLLTVLFLALHVVTIELDTFVPIRWRDVFVPFISAYHPMWLALGAIAVDLIVAVILTSLLRTRISVQTWRAVHWLSYAAWPFAMLHGLGVGSDRHARWFYAIEAACLISVAAAAVWRWTRQVPDTPAVIDGRVVTGGGSARVAPGRARRIA